MTNSKSDAVACPRGVEEPHFTTIYKPLETFEFRDTARLEMSGPAKLRDSNRCQRGHAESRTSSKSLNVWPATPLFVSTSVFAQSDRLKESALPRMTLPRHVLLARTKKPNHKQKKSGDKANYKLKAELASHWRLAVQGPTITLRGVPLAPSGE
jgi:hypothetical protein